MRFILVGFVTLKDDLNPALDLNWIVHRFLVSFLSFWSTSI